MFANGLYLLVILCICLGNFLNASERHIGLYIVPEWRGESALAYRMQAACQNLNWHADIITPQNSYKLKDKEYDFVINLCPTKYYHPKCKNYLAIFEPIHHFFNENGLILQDYQFYDGYLLTYSPGTCGIPKNEFEDPDNFPFMQWYPSVQKHEYRIVDPSYLFHICCPWGNRFEDQKFKTLLSLLDKEDFTRFYGFVFFKFLYPTSYQGEIPWDCDSLINIASEAGIVLILHSSIHNTFGLPSGRIFEAASSSAVIICDENPFVKTHFGDSVLYINTEASALEIYQQILHHMNWIKNNKLAALKKAKKSYDILKGNFLLEKQLLKLEKFHEKVLSKQ